ncbi:putative RNA methyltransferase [uncultured Jatrophihabitans sp.]|uniref:putative RNA methyltransferase n=1 Tax=uncultured Jatrophihabitans sp. TaxID=1610747 RepID=UPI0035C9D4B2
MLADLRCPVCADPFTRSAGTVSCPQGHAFDVARQGYLNLTAGARGPGTADTAAMVAARAAFLAAGHFALIADAVADATAHAAGLVVDVAGGTGYYLAAALGKNERATGLCLDLSVPALRRAASAHARAAAVGADAWQRLPLVTGRAAAVLSIFGPRNADEVERILALDGVFIVVSPRDGHLRELVDRLGLIGVDPDKARRQAATFARFDQLAEQRVTYPLALDHAAALAAAEMGPSAAHHDAAELARRAAHLPDVLEVRVDVSVAAYGRSVGSRSPL